MPFELVSNIADVGSMRKKKKRKKRHFAGWEMMHAGCVRPHAEKNSVSSCGLSFLIRHGDLIADRPVFENKIRGFRRMRAEFCGVDFVLNFLIFVGGFEAHVFRFVEIMKNLKVFEIFRAGITLDDHKRGICFRGCGKLGNDRLLINPIEAGKKRSHPAGVHVADPKMKINEMSIAVLDVVNATNIIEVDIAPCPEGLSVVLAAPIDHRGAVIVNCGGKIHRFHF